MRISAPRSRGCSLPRSTAQSRTRSLRSIPLPAHLQFHPAPEKSLHARSNLKLLCMPKTCRFQPKPYASDTLSAGAAPANFEGRCWGGARSLTRGAAQFYIYILLYIYITVYIYIYMLMSQTWKYFCFKPWRRANGYYISNVKILRKRYAGERLNLSKLEKVKVKTE